MTRVSVTVFGMVVLVGDLINSHFYLLDGYRLTMQYGTYFCYSSTLYVEFGLCKC